MFKATLFVTAKTWEQPRCPEGSEWINKRWYIQTRENYSEVERNELSSYKEKKKRTQSNLKCMLLSKESQSENATYYDSN